jgi:phosphotransferase system IIB component
MRGYNRAFVTQKEKDARKAVALNGSLLPGALSPSQQAIAAGLKSLREVSQMVGKPVRTLYNWYENYPNLFDITLLGCVAKLHQHMNDEEKVAEIRREALNDAAGAIRAATDTPYANVYQVRAYEQAAEIVDLME